MKKVVVITCLMLSYLGFSQTDLNNYKYIIVPKKFEGFKDVNQYQTSTLMKYLFDGKGFTPVYDDALPEDLKMNRCLGLLAELQDDSNMFTTKTKIALKDCNGLEVFTTIEGTSKIKQYKEAFNQAIKEAMHSFNNMDYAYNGEQSAKASQEPIKVSFKNDVKQLKESKATKANDYKDAKESKMVIEQIATETEQLYKDKTPIASNMTKGEKSAPEFKQLEIKEPFEDEVWYAQSTENGYQLVDSTPKIRMQLLKSSADNVYMAQSDARNGMVYEKDEQWIFEYYENGELVQEKLNIKF
ncbi:MAG: hypothetical protein WBB24_14685 [Maribacter sp.]